MSIVYFPSGRGCCGEGVTRRESEGEFSGFCHFSKNSVFLTMKQVEVETVRTGESCDFCFLMMFRKKC